MNPELDERYLQLLARKAKPFELKTFDQEKLLKHAIYFFFQSCKNHQVADLIFELLEKGHHAPIEFCGQVVLTFIHSTEQSQAENTHWEQIILKVIQQLLGKDYFVSKFGELRPKSQCALHVILQSLQALDNWLYWTNEDYEALGAFIEAVEVDNERTATMIVDAVKMSGGSVLLLKPILKLLNRTDGIWAQEKSQIMLLDATRHLHKFPESLETLKESVVLIELVEACLKRISNADHQQSHLIFQYAYDNIYQVATEASKENKRLSDPLLMIELVRKVTPAMIPLTRAENEHFEKTKKYYLAYEQWGPASAETQNVTQVPIEDAEDLRALAEPLHNSRCVKALEMLIMMSRISYTTAADIMIPAALELANSSDFRVVEGALRMIHIIANECRRYYSFDREAIFQLLVSKMRSKKYSSIQEEAEDQVVRCAACYALAAMERQVQQPNTMLKICQELGSSPVSPMFMNAALHACLRIIANNKYQIDSLQGVHGCLEALNACLSRNIAHLSNYRLMCDVLKDIYCFTDLSSLPPSLTKKLLHNMSLQRFASRERQNSFFNLLADFTNRTLAPEMKEVYHHILKSYLWPTLTSSIGVTDPVELAPVIDCYGDCISELGDESLPYINETIFKALIGMLNPNTWSDANEEALKVLRWCSWLLSFSPSQQQKHNLEWLGTLITELLQQLAELVPNYYQYVEDYALECFGNFAMKLPQTTVLMFADPFLEAICSRSKVDQRMCHVIAQLATAIPEHTASKTSRLFPILFNSHYYLTSAAYTPLLLQGVLNMIRLNLAVGFFAFDECDYQFLDTESMVIILEFANYKVNSSQGSTFKRSPRYSPTSPTYSPGFLVSLDICPTPRSSGNDSPSINQQTQEAPASPEYERTPSPQYDHTNSISDLPPSPEQLSPPVIPGSPQFSTYDNSNDYNNEEEVDSPSRKRQRTEMESNDTPMNVARACSLLMKFQFDAIPYSLKYQVAQVLLQFKFRIPRRFWELHLVCLPEMRKYLNLVSIFNTVPLALTDIKLQTFK